MKKITKISVLIISIMMLLTITSNAFTAETSVTSDNVKVGEEITYTIKLDSNVIAANFDIKYDDKNFELIGSNTTGLNVSKNGEVISCIYIDMNEQGTNEFAVRFKAIKKDKEATFSVENAKFRILGQQNSNTLQNTNGLAIQKVQVKNITMTSLLWLAVIGIGVIVMESIILVIANKIKSKKQLKVTKKMMTIVLALFTLGILSSNVKATENDVIINFSKVGEEKIVQILLSKDDSDRMITKEEVIAKNNTITSIKDENENEIQNTDIVKTGYKVQTANGTSTVVLLGDANKDGIVCDTDDIMVIINDYLGKQKADSIMKVAANLYNADDVLDTDDIMQMMNMYLGKLEGQILVNPIESNTEEAVEKTVKLEMYAQDFDTKYAIEGATFQILDEETDAVIGTVTTNANGWASIDLSATEHYNRIKIEQTATKNGYTSLDKLLYLDYGSNIVDGVAYGWIEFVNDEYASAERVNDKISVKVLNKKSNETTETTQLDIYSKDFDTSYAIEGTTFQVLDMKTKAVIGTATTNADGWAKVGLSIPENKNITSIILRQISANDGYTLYVNDIFLYPSKYKDNKLYTDTGDGWELYNESNKKYEYYVTIGDPQEGKLVVTVLNKKNNTNSNLKTVRVEIGAALAKDDSWSWEDASKWSNVYFEQSYDNEKVSTYINNKVIFNAGEEKAILKLAFNKEVVYQYEITRDATKITNVTQIQAPTGDSNGAILNSLRESLIGKSDKVITIKIPGYLTKSTGVPTWISQF